MTLHDQISAYIDNELGAEQEQDFLISLASSDGLRKSFRSELVLKNVIHQDEVLTTPSRDMRGVVLTTLGIAGVSALASETADAATTAASATKATFVKTLFASKLNALITASMVTASALGGYAVRTIVAEKPVNHTVAAPIIRNTQPTFTAPSEVASPVNTTPTTDMSSVSTPKMVAAKHKSVAKVIEPAKTDPAASTIPGTGGASMKSPVIESSKK